MLRITSFGHTEQENTLKYCFWENQNEFSSWTISIEEAVEPGCCWWYYCIIYFLLHKFPNFAFNQFGWWAMLSISSIRDRKRIDLSNKSKRFAWNPKNIFCLIVKNISKVWKNKKLIINSKRFDYSFIRNIGRMHDRRNIHTIIWLWVFVWTIRYFRQLCMWCVCLCCLNVSIERWV